MQIFHSENGTIEISWWRGLVITTPFRGRRKATAALRTHAKILRQELKRRGHDISSDKQLAAEFWHHIIELANAPDNGLYHRAVFSQPIQQTADHILSVRNHTTNIL